MRVRVVLLKPWNIGEDNWVRSIEKLWSVVRARERAKVGLGCPHPTSVIPWPDHLVLLHLIRCHPICIRIPWCIPRQSLWWRPLCCSPVAALRMETSAARKSLRPPAWEVENSVGNLGPKSPSSMATGRSFLWDGVCEVNCSFCFDIANPVRPRFVQLRFRIVWRNGRFYTVQRLQLLQQLPSTSPLPSMNISLWFPLTDPGPWRFSMFRTLGPPGTWPSKPRCRRTPRSARTFRSAARPSSACSMAWIGHLDGCKSTAIEDTLPKHIKYIVNV